MAAELAAGYISLSVKLAKGGMADITKEVKKAGTEGGTVYSDEFNKQVEKDVGKKLPDTIGKSTTKSGGLAKAAKEAATEFGKGMLDGVEDALGTGGGIADTIGKVSKTGLGKAAKDAATEFGKGMRDGIEAELKSGGIEGALGTINDKVKETTGLINQIGGATGINTAGIESAAGTISTAIEGIGTSVGSAKGALEAFSTGDIAGGLQAAADAFKGLESIGLPEGFSREVGEAATKFSEVQTSVNNVTTSLEGLPLGKLEKAIPLLDEIIATASVLEDSLGKPIDEFLSKTVPGADATSWSAWWADIKAIFEDDPITPKVDFDGARLDLKGFYDLFENPPPITVRAVPGSDALDPKFFAPSPIPPSAPPVPLNLSRQPGGRAAGDNLVRGPGGVDNVLSWLTAGEGVVKKSAMQSGGAAIVAALNRQGGIPGFAGGSSGVTSEIERINQLAAQFGLSLTSGRRNESGSFHNSGQAGDFSNGSGNTPEMLAFAKYMATNFGASIQELIYSDPNFSQLIGGGKNVTGTGYYSAGTLSQHRNHVHIAVKPGNLPALGNQPLVPADTSTASTPSNTSSSTSSSSSGGGGLGPSGTFQPGENPYAKLMAAEKQRIEAIKGMLPDMGALADIGVGGLKETLLPPGFSDPTQWKSVASIGALLKSIGILSGNPQVSSIMGGIGAGITGSGSGLYQGIMGAIPQPYGNLAPQPGAPQPGQFPNAQPGVGTGPLPGPAPGVPGFPGQPGPGNVNISQYNDNSGKGLQDANRQTHFDNQPHTVNFARIQG